MGTSVFDVSDFPPATTLKVGIIGGTGLENSEFMTVTGTASLDTPYGPPSDLFLHGKINGVEVFVLSRHGRDHAIPPTSVNFRANLWALKKLGVNVILASNASGSLKEEFAPGSIVIPNDFIDWTTQRARSFYDHAEGHATGVCHIPCFPAYSEVLQNILVSSGKAIGVPVHQGTIIVIEGPRFSTRAESVMFQKLGADVINMTACPEVYLAKELGLLYAAAALVTDYDCWRVHDSEFVTVEHVKEVMNLNAKNTTKLFAHAIAVLKTKAPEVLKAAADAEVVAKSSVMD